MSAERASDPPYIDLASLIDRSADEIFVIDSRSGRYLFANERALQNIGYSLEELTSMTPLDLQVGTEAYEILARIQPLRTGAAQFAEFPTTYTRKDGTSYDVMNRVELVRHLDDVPVFVARLRPAAEDALLRAIPESVDRYRRIVEDAEEGVWVIDRNSCTTYVNERMAAMLGYERHEMLGASLFSFMDDEGKVIAEANVERRRQGIREQHDFKMTHKNGADVWMIIAANPLFDAAGEYAGSVGLFTDITARKERERALLASLHVATVEDLLVAEVLPEAGVYSLGMPSVAGLRASRVAKRFSVLADPRRLELIELLATGDELPVGALADALCMSQSNVSKHLKVLSDAGLVTRRSGGSRTYYTLSDPTVAVICRIVCHWLGNQAQAEFLALAS